MPGFMCGKISFQRYPPKLSVRFFKFVNCTEGVVNTIHWFAESCLHMQNRVLLLVVIKDYGSAFDAAILAHIH